MSNTARSKLHHLPIDRGWAWAIVVAVFGRMMMIVGLIASISILFVEFMSAYNASTLATSWIPSMMLLMTLGMGPFSNALAARFTTRPVAIAGALCVFLGGFLSSFATNITHLYLTFGLLIGSGFGLMNAPSFVLLGQYFEVRRTLAMGICGSGGGIGFVLFPIITRVLLDEYGLNGALLLLAGILAHLFVCAGLMRPLQFYLKRNVKTENETSYEPTRKVTKEPIRRDVPVIIISTSDDAESKSLPNIFTECNKPYSPLNMNSEKEANLSVNAPTHLPVASSDIRECDIRKSTTDAIKHSSVGTVSNGEEDSVDIEALKNFIQRQRTKSIGDYDRLRLHSLPSGARNPRSYRMNLDSRNDSANSAYGVTSTRSRTSLKQLSPAESKRSLVSSLALSNEDLFIASLQSFSSQRSENIPATSLCSRIFAVRQKDPVTGETVKPGGVFNFTLLKNPIYILIVISYFWIFVALNLPMLFLGAYAETVGLTKSQTAIVIAVAGIPEIFVRPLVGWFADLNLVPKNYIMTAVILVNTIISGVWHNIADFYGLLIVALIYEVCVGSYFTLMPVIMMDLLGLEVFSQAFGMSFLFQSVGKFVGAPLAGWLRDATGDWLWTYLFVSFCLAASVIALLLIPLVKRYQDKKNPGSNT